jgi:hypothetical protein
MSSKYARKSSSLISRVGSAVRTTSASAASPRELAVHCRANPIGFPICHACRGCFVRRVTTTGVVRAVLAFTGRSAQRTLRVSCRVGSAVRTTSGSSVSPHDIAAHCQVNPIGFFNRPLRPCWTFDYNRRFPHGVSVHWMVRTADPTCLGYSPTSFNWEMVAGAKEPQPQSGV